ncbi:MAG TPA: VOC family protein [Thermomicrobiaceae bacterium]|nr:VOC family protein [Thermomicrobiaceae bacterium]
MASDLFAGIPVTDYAAAVPWYERLFGAPPSFLPTDTEAVWALAEHGFVFIEQQPERAGHGRHLLFVDDLDALVEGVAARGLTPVGQETLGNGVRRVVYRDPDGNQFEFGGAPR